MRIKRTIIAAASLVILFPFGLLGAAWLLLPDWPPGSGSEQDTADASGDDETVTVADTTAGYSQITAPELKARLDDESESAPVILDIRDGAAYDNGHIPGAINIPLGELGYRVFALDRTKDIIVYCNLGLQGSEIACRILANAGFKDVYNLTGGLSAWSYPIETSDGSVSI